jgi:serine/threonine-protein kinase RsbT
MSMAPVDESRVDIGSDADLVHARQIGRELATELGFSRTEATLIATAISELARNILSYAGKGQIAVSRIFENGRYGLVVVAVDTGPGIVDVEAAMQEGFSTAGGLGMGLPGARRLVDEFDIVSELGRGTTVTLKKWRRHGG